MKRNILTLLLFLISTTNLFSQLSLEVVWEKPRGGVIDAKFSPDGKFVYCAIGADIKKLDVETGEFVATFDKGELTQPNQYLVLSPDGKWIITLGYLGGVYLWDTKLQKVVREIKPSGMLENQSLGLASFFPDSKKVLLTSYIDNGHEKPITRELLVYEVISNNILRRVTNTNAIQQLQTSKDGKYFITGSVYKDWQGNGFCKVTLWDANTLEPIRDYEVPEGNKTGFRKIQLSDNNKLIGLATHNTNIVKILETETGKVVKTSDVGMNGYDFELLPNSYYLIYQENESNINEYGFQIFKYPGIFQSNLKRLASGVIISNITEDDKISIFCISQGMTLLRSTTTSITNNPTEQFIFKVESDKIIVSFKNAESFKIIDMHGNIVLEKSVNEPVFSIPNTFSTGTYICVIKSGDREYSQKFQVVR